MKALPSALRRYLWGVYLACAALCMAELPPLIAHVQHWRRDPADAGILLLFAILAYAGERTTLEVSPTTLQSLATSVYVAAILLFPPPLPLVIALAAVGLSQLLHERTPLVKRAFNIAHSALLVGGSSLLLALIAPPGPLLPAHHLLAATPLIVVLLLVFYTLDVGPMLVLLGLLEGQTPWRVWAQTYRRTLVPELAASAMGILAAAVWYSEPAYLGLFIIPVAALRTAFRAIVEREERAAALRRRGGQLETILATARQLEVPGPDLRIALAEAARRISGAGVAAVYVRDDSAAPLMRRAALIPPEASGARPPLSRMVPDRGVGVWTEGAGAERAMVVPLDEDDHGLHSLVWLGALAADSPECQDVLAILAAQGRVTLQNWRLHEQALARAAEDSLTELLNHRSLHNRLDEELARAGRTGRPLSFLMIDLDDFGLVNNTYGHPAGDAAIIAVAGALRAHARAIDILGRYGGDEFALILPYTALEEAVEVADRIRAAIAAVQVVASPAAIRVSASIGVAASPLHGRARADLVHAADRAAYAAKQAGKDRVRLPEDARPGLDRDPQELLAQLAHANMATVEALAAAVDAKDGYTSGHSRRVSAYATAIAYALELAPTAVARLRLAGLLHDVGKIGIPDVILTKPGPLDSAEYALIQEHAALGAQMLAAVPSLHEILPALRHHHEWWDGQGYPDGLAGASIPPDATILMVADAFDAMTSARLYQPALPWAEAWRRVRDGRGTQFAPAVVDALEHALASGILQAPVGTVEDTPIRNARTMTDQVPGLTRQ